MISITPQGDIYLCKTPLENDYKNQLTFTNSTTQLQYFNSKIVKTLNNYTYIKKDNYIKVGYPIDEIIECNYLFYRNNGFTTKYYFCFITNMEYINENCTGITFETDVWQTYQFNLTYNPCFVEREHVNDDTVGLHTIPENLETGDYITQLTGNDTITDMYYLSDFYIVIAVSEVGLPISIPSGYKQYNGVYSGLLYLCFRDSENADKYIRNIQSNTTQDVIYAIFIAPANLCGINSSDWFTVQSGSGITTSFEMAYIPYTSFQTNMGNISITKPSFLDKSYTPRNKKLLCYPYRYLLVSNNAGTVKEYKYELFNTTNCEFYIKGAIGVGCSIKMYPNKYNLKTNESIGSETLSKLDSIDANKLPTCSWFNDSFTNYLTANAVNIPLGITESAFNTITGAVIGNPTQMVGGLSGISHQLASLYEHSLAPLTAKGGANESDLIFAQRNTYNYYKMSIKEEYAKCIDKYFDMFGYKVNSVKTPNITGRTNWNFVKTIECNFEGDIPQQHLSLIKQMFNNGVTLWHNPNTMYNYSNTNSIVS